MRWSNNCPVLTGSRNIASRARTSRWILRLEPDRAAAGDIAGAQSLAHDALAAEPAGRGPKISAPSPWSCSASCRPGASAFLTMQAMGDLAAAIPTEAHAIQAHALKIDLYLHQQGHRYDHARRQGHVPHDGRVCRVRPRSATMKRLAALAVLAASFLLAPRRSVLLPLGVGAIAMVERDSA